MNKEKEIYLETEFERVKLLYTKKKHQKGFKNKDGLAKWFTDALKKQDFTCHYCETSIFDIKKLIDNDLLKTRKVNKKGRRGPNLEIECKENSLINKYSPENCVLACYYCNNDKSYIFEHSEYKISFGAFRKTYFAKLLKILRRKSGRPTI